MTVWAWQCTVMTVVAMTVLMKFTIVVAVSTAGAVMMMAGVVVKAIIWMVYIEKTVGHVIVMTIINVVTSTASRLLATTAIRTT